MKTVTTREAQHHLSKVIKMVQKGEDVMVTRRGEAVVRMSSPENEVSPDAQVDWSDVIQKSDETLAKLPQSPRNSVLAMREEERF